MNDARNRIKTQLDFWLPGTNDAGIKSEPLGNKLLFTFQIRKGEEFPFIWCGQAALIDTSKEPVHVLDLLVDSDERGAMQWCEMIYKLRDNLPAAITFTYVPMPGEAPRPGAAHPHINYQTLLGWMRAKNIHPVA